MSGLKPMFTFYGGKWRAAPKYPKPRHAIIVEPFAGSAGYSLRYPHRDVLLCDVDPVISALWAYLIRVSSREIMALPTTIEDTVNSLKVCQEAKWLIGFWLNKGSSRPMLSPSAWMRSRIRPKSFWGLEIKQRIASQVSQIRHWKISNASYDSLSNSNSTWFIDPPYSGPAGQHYRCKLDDYGYLAEWCKSRKGRIIVCENEGAVWLPFSKAFDTKSNPSKRGKGFSKEVVWFKDQ